MIDAGQFKYVLDDVLEVALTIQEKENLTRAEIAGIRFRLTRALAETNHIERLVVGEPMPKSGD